MYQDNNNQENKMMIDNKMPQNNYNSNLWEPPVNLDGLIYIIINIKYLSIYRI